MNEPSAPIEHGILFMTEKKKKLKPRNCCNNTLKFFAFFVIIGTCAFMYHMAVQHQKLPAIPPPPFFEEKLKKNQFYIVLENMNQVSIPVKKLYGSFTLSIEHETNPSAPSGVYAASGGVRHRLINCIVFTPGDDSTTTLNVHWDKSSDVIKVSKTSGNYDGKYRILFSDNTF